MSEIDGKFNESTIQNQDHITARTQEKPTTMAARKEILFDGFFYDVTDFVSKHPGGPIIKYYTGKGEDGTQAIQQFHKRSIEKVRVMMSALKKRPASDSESRI